MKVRVTEIKFITKRIFQQIKAYLRDVIIDLQESARWKKQLTVALNFVSSGDTEEEPVMHSKKGIKIYTF